MTETGFADASTGHRHDASTARLALRDRSSSGDRCRSLGRGFSLDDAAAMLDVSPSALRSIFMVLDVSSKSSWHGWLVFAT
jgi:hypothetical protein